MNPAADATTLTNVFLSHVYTVLYTSSSYYITTLSIVYIGGICAVQCRSRKFCHKMEKRVEYLVTVAESIPSRK